MPHLKVLSFSIDCIDNVKSPVPTLNNAPRVESASDPLASGLHHSVAADHCKWSALLKAKGQMSKVRLSVHSRMDSMSMLWNGKYNIQVLFINFCLFVCFIICVIVFL